MPTYYKPDYAVDLNEAKRLAFAGHSAAVHVML